MRLSQDADHPQDVELETLARAVNPLVEVKALSPVTVINASAAAVPPPHNISKAPLLVLVPKKLFVVDVVSV